MLLALPSELAAREPTPIAGSSFDVSGKMEDTLKSLTGKRVYMSLRSGAIYVGLVKAVGDHFVHIEKIQATDFYGALIRMEDISAIELQFREL